MIKKKLHQPRNVHVPLIEALKRAYQVVKARVIKILLRLTVREPPGEIVFFFEKKRELMTKKRDGPSIRAIWRG